MTIKYLKENNLLLLECISGSTAYGLNTAQSDVDLKGVYFLPEKDFYGLNYIPQVADEKNDCVYYELKRFFELLFLNNPNILELLSTPENCILYQHPLFKELKVTWFLSKLCQNTFGKYAVSQIKKAKGLNKKIVNPISKIRKSVLDFCFINYEQGSIPIHKFLEIKTWKQEHCGLVNIPNMAGVFGLYYDKKQGYKGLLKKENSNELSLSSIPKGAEQEALLFFNHNGYSTYCKEYNQYWKWVKNRNEVRYNGTLEHGKNYDAKNMMHVFRLLEMAIEIGNTHKINVKRPNRDFLLDIKKGKFEYEELKNLAAEKQIEMETAFLGSSLPEKPDLDLINQKLYEFRKSIYKH